MATRGISERVLAIRFITKRFNGLVCMRGESEITLGDESQLIVEHELVALNQTKHHNSQTLLST